MHGRVLIAAVAATLVAVGVVASTSSAGQSIPQLLVSHATPVLDVGPLQFGTVPVGTQVVKPLAILNRTSEWVHYGGATWPNLQYPGAGVQPFPKGFWNVSGSGPDFPCYDIAPRGSCTLKFGWQPFEGGTHTAAFMTWYVGSVSGKTYASNTMMMIGSSPSTG